MVGREHLGARPMHHRACYSERADAPSEVVEGIASNLILWRIPLPVGLQGTPLICLLEVILSPKIVPLGTCPLYVPVFESR